MNEIDLKGRVAIITGGAAGIGLACARRFLESGAQVSLWDLSRESLDQAKAELEAFSADGGTDFSEAIRPERAKAKIRFTAKAEVSPGP